jgi:hypothetical protein
MSDKNGDDKVTHLSKVKSNAAPEVDPQMVLLCEKVLELVKSGEIRTIAVVTVCKTMGDILACAGDKNARLTLLGGMTALSTSISNTIPAFSNGDEQ